MKKKQRKRVPQAQVARMAFTRGLVATGVLAFAESGGGALSRTALRRALKSGIAVASGTLVADSLERDEPLKAVLAIAGGIVGAAATDRLLAVADQEQERVRDGKEEIG